jgi:hypothetical protein
VFVSSASASRADRPAQIRRAGAIALLSCVASLGLGLGPASGRQAGAAPRSARARAAAVPSHLQVTQVEYRLLLSRGTVRAGTLNLEEIDGGRDPHDLRLRRTGSGSTIYGRLLTPGRRWEGAVRMQPGTYELWCSLPEHAKLGMHTTLRVTS